MDIFDDSQECGQRVVEDIRSLTQAEPAEKNRKIQSEQKSSLPKRKKFYYL